MTWEIAAVFLLLALALVSFVWEKIPADLTALSLFAILMATGLLPVGRALSVFANPAPITVGAMFILSAALVKSGAIDSLSGLIEKTATWSYPVVILLLVIVVEAISAFVNNTPVVVVFLPVVLNLARKMQTAPSKLLIPLSYAAVLGGTCTLIGTSTNLVVNGIATAKGLPSFSFFEIAWLGVPTALIGALYLAIFGQKLLPVREMLTAILSEDERREYLTEAYVQAGSPVLGRTLAEAGLTAAKGVRVLEIVRDGVAYYFDAKNVRLRAGDRLILSCRPKGIVHTRSIEGVDLVAELNLGLEQIAAHEGALVEGVITPNSGLLGHTIREINFRQRFRMVALALHRQGRNVREQLDTLPLKAGDVLLMMGTDPAIEQLRRGDDIVLFDRPALPARTQTRKIPLVLGVIFAVIVTASFDWVPIEVGAIVGSVILCACGCLRTKDAYGSIEWNIIFLICGMLAMGLAMEQTGAAAWLARQMVDGVNTFVAPGHKAFAMLACVYVITALFTEVLSNNAIAAIMAPIAIGIAAHLRLSPTPFLVAVTFAASSSFSSPIGYQTNTYVYGVGGYRFSDFPKIGIPLNIICFIVAMLVIPHVWSF